MRVIILSSLRVAVWLLVTSVLLLRPGARAAAENSVAATVAG